MKWKNEIPNKTEFMKVNSFNFIENEKLNCAMVHEKNTYRITPIEEGQIMDTSKERKESQIPVSKGKDQDLDCRRTMTETITLSETRTDFSGLTPKRYTTHCYIKPKTVPSWYHEALYLKIGSNKQKYQEKVYFKNTWKPIHWSETMSTEIKTGPKCVFSEAVIPISDEGFHYISLHPQQAANQNSTDL